MTHVPVPAGVEFRRSSYSGGGNCVEVGADGNQVYVRNSRYPGSAIAFAAGSWAAFVEWLKAEGAPATSRAASGSP